MAPQNPVPIPSPSGHPASGTSPTTSPGTPQPSPGPTATVPSAQSTEYNPNGSGKNNGLSLYPGKSPDEAKWPPIKGKGQVNVSRDQLESYAKALEADLATLKKALDKVLNDGGAPGHNVGVGGDPADLFSEVLTTQHKAFTTYFSNVQQSYQDVATGLRTALGKYNHAETNATPVYTPPNYQ